MMKKSILALATLAFMAWGCSTDDETSREIPQGNDERPTWQIPDYNLFEQTMSVEVQLQDTLIKYASAADLMCATIGGEVRSVQAPLEFDGQWLYLLVIASNDTGVPVSLSYYCQKLRRIFTIENWTTFDATIEPMGTGGIYKPIFVK